MKKQIILFLTLFTLGNLLFAQLQTKGVFVCNEGLMDGVNGTIAYLNQESNQGANYDYFQAKNNRSIGDTPNDIKIYGSKVYVPVIGSSQVEIFDVNTGKSLKQIPMFNGTAPRKPRYVAFYENKAYVSAFDGKVYRIDTTSLEIDGSVAVGRNPEGLCVVGNKLYVANSGGLDGMNNGNYDNTVSIVDIATFSEERKIEVGVNPYKLLPDGYGGVYVTIRGNYSNVPSSFNRIDTATKQVETFAIDVLNFDIYGKYAYVYSTDFSNFPDISSWVKRFDLETKTLESNSFITDGTKVNYAYGIKVNPANGNVYVMNASEDFISNGDLFCFSQEGKLQFKVADIGIGPNSVAFYNVESTSAIAQSVEVKNSITVYPNPVVENFQITHAAFSQLQVFNQRGMLVLSQTLKSNSEIINIQHLPAGIYLLKIVGNNGVQQIKKIVKQ